MEVDLKAKKHHLRGSESSSKKGSPMKIDSVDLFYLRMPEVLDIGDGSQDALLVRVTADGYVGCGEA